MKNQGTRKWDTCTREERGYNKPKKNLLIQTWKARDKNVMFCTTVDPSTTKEGKIYSDLCGRFPTISSRGNKYVYVMYVYDCNAILTTAIKNRSDKETIRTFTELIGDLLRCGINPGFHLMDNEASTALNMTMNSMNIKYQLVPQSNHGEKNAERTIQNFKDHFIAGMCSIDK